MFHAGIYFGRPLLISAFLSFIIPAFFKGLLEELPCSVLARAVSQKGFSTESRKSWPQGWGQLFRVIVKLRVFLIESFLFLLHRKAE